MTCYEHEGFTPGDSINDVYSKTMWCGDCNNTFVVDKTFSGAYMGHYFKAGVMYDMIKLNEPYLCPHCGYRVDVNLYACTEHNISSPLTDRLFSFLGGNDVNP